MMADQLRGMSVGELRTTLDQKHLELMNLRFQFASNQLEDGNRLRQVRREIA
ncbi:MAG: 50S ribosomal protein L29, partial [Anaerolineae bacterium]|nr:50S ribosomal protein L29 [Anaerolineae bacterium]